MEEKVSMPRIERQLRLYECVCRYEITTFATACEVFPYNKRLLQRDLADLKAAGLVGVKYSKKGKGYIKTGVPDPDEEAKPCKKAHLRRLNRLGCLMAQLENEDIPLWEKKDNEEEGETREYFTAKDSYNQLFPGLSERTRQRDFEVLRNIGYQVFYDHLDHCFSQDEFDFAWNDAPQVIDHDYLEGNYW